jgi:inhibitor of KinA sporulation pathway (predicted exonuclease)
MKKYVILDLEWTSWKGNHCGNNQEKRKSWQKKEIIQIGGVKFDKNYKIIDKLNIYVKPIFNPILSDYIKNLTGISQKKLEKTGMIFAQSYKIFKKFCKGTKIFSNGDDNLIMKINLDYNNLIDRKLNIINIKKILNLKYKIPKKFIDSSMIHTFFGYKLKKNKMHNAMHDCLNVLKVLKKTKFIL